jgi:hypothetical protein
MPVQFKAGDYVIYLKGDTCEIGKIKRITPDGAFVWYHIGSTCACTPLNRLIKITNSYVIASTLFDTADRE